MLAHHAGCHLHCNIQGYARWFTVLDILFTHTQMYQTSCLPQFPSGGTSVCIHFSAGKHFTATIKQLLRHSPSHFVVCGCVMNAFLKATTSTDSLAVGHQNSTVLHTRQPQHLRTCGCRFKGPASHQDASCASGAYCSLAGCYASRQMS